MKCRLRTSHLTKSEIRLRKCQKKTKPSEPKCSGGRVVCRRQHPDVGFAISWTLDTCEIDDALGSTARAATDLAHVRIDRKLRDCTPAMPPHRSRAHDRHLRHSVDGCRVGAVARAPHTHTERDGEALAAAPETRRTASRSHPDARCRFPQFAVWQVYCWR